MTLDAPPELPRGVDDSQTRRDAMTFFRLARAYRTMRGGDTLFALGTLLRNHGDQPGLDVPEPSPQTPGVHLTGPATRTHYASAEDYLAARPGPKRRLVVALPYNGVGYPIDPGPIAARLTEALSDDAWVLPVAIEIDAASAVDRTLELCATPGLEPDLAMTLVSFRFGTGPTGGDADHGVAVLNQLGMPYLSPVLLTRTTAEEWLHHSDGLGPFEMLVSVTLPEFDGTVNQIPIAIMTPPRHDARHRVDTTELQIINEQLDRLVGRIRGLLRLQDLANTDKRVCLIGYDCPAGEGNLLAASQLDVAESITAILVEFHRTDYYAQPVTAAQLRANLMAGQVSSPAYLTKIQSLIYPHQRAQADLGNQQVQDEITRVWSADGPHPMVDSDGDCLIPHVKYGNVLVSVQPGRAPKVDGALAHDNTVPPHPQYLAYHTWLQHVWRADAIVHVGTHGMLEFLGSEKSAVSVHDFPDLVVGSIPYAYLYYASNPTEALLAERYSHTTLVSYQPPVVTSDELYGELEELVEALTAYRHNHAMTPQSNGDQLADLKQRAERAHLPTNPNQLEDELERLRAQLIPLGLRVFGGHWNADEVTYMVAGMIGNGVGDLIPGCRLMATTDGLDVERIHHLDEAEIARYDEAAKRLVETTLTDQAPATDLAGDGTSQAVIVRAHELALRLAADQEREFLHRALSGHHAETRFGGDAIHNPKVLFSGASLYQFNPRQVPSTLAAHRGAEMAAQVVEVYRGDHGGAWPSCVGLVLWGLETTRTHGETYAQVISLIGVCRVPSRHPGLSGWEVVPREELPGPRMDMVVTISGLFRDLFGTLVEELDDMFIAIAALDEPNKINPIAVRTRRPRQYLLGDGMTGPEAREFSHARVFGPPPELYATRLTDVIGTGNWSSTTDLAEHFTQGAQHLCPRHRHGKKVPDLYRGHLTDVQLVTQCRSSNEHHITDLSHYFEFLGGMSAGIAAAHGETVPTLVTDTTRWRVCTATTTGAARAGLYTQLLSPAWVEAMLARGHQGVGEIAKRTTNLLGLAATTGEMANWVFDAVCDRFLDDPEMLRRLREANPHATAAIAGRLLEASRRDLWQACEERIDTLENVQFDTDTGLREAGETGAWDRKG